MKRNEGARMKTGQFIKELHRLIDELESTGSLTVAKDTLDALHISAGHGRCIASLSPEDRATWRGWLKGCLLEVRRAMDRLN